MKKTNKHRLLLGLLTTLLAASGMTGCHKEKDSPVTTSGGGASTQSVVTLKGAAQ